MKFYSISVHPKAGIGYCFVAKGENAHHALSVLSYSLRNCLKMGVEDTSGLHLVESLRIIRKYWRYTSNKMWTVQKVIVLEIDVMKASYDIPLIPRIRLDGTVEVTETSNYSKLHEELHPRISHKTTAQDHS